MILARYGRELAAAAALAVLLAILAVAAPSFFAAGNLRDLLLNNTGVLLVAAGMTLVILAGHIDISVGAQFAICGVVAGALAREGLPLPLALAASIAAGAGFGAAQGALVARAGIPSIVVTLAGMIALRDALRWITEGVWIQNLPPQFQWAGFGPAAGPTLVVSLAAVLVAVLAWSLRHLAAGRWLYATGADPEAARLAGIPTRSVVFSSFLLLGALTGVAAFLNAIRFSQVPVNAGIGLELKTIAAVVIGGASINGGRATVTGTLLGVALLGVIGTALVYLGINPYWEKAVQGAIILAAAVARSGGVREAHAVAR